MDKIIRKIDRKAEKEYICDKFIVMLAQNLKYLRSLANLSQAELAEKLGIPRTTLSAYERSFVEPNIDLLIKLGKFFKVQIDDLIAGNIESKNGVNDALHPLKVLAITVDQNNRNNIELVQSKAEAGYLDSFTDPEFIKDLPKISFPNIPQGTYRGFEIRGDSMLPMEPGSIVISSYVEKLNDIKDDKTYVVISKAEGVVYKRVKNLANEKVLLLRSDNEAYSPYKLPYEEIAELWQYYAHLSFSDAKQTFNTMLEEKIHDMHKKLDKMYAKVLG